MLFFIENEDEDRKMTSVYVIFFSENTLTMHVCTWYWDHFYWAVFICHQNSRKDFKINEFHWNDEGVIKLMENMHRKRIKGLSPLIYTLIIEIQRNLIAGSISVQ